MPALRWLSGTVGASGAQCAAPKENNKVNLQFKYIFGIFAREFGLCLIGTSLILL
jgi:hypothetical protein